MKRSVVVGALGTAQMLAWGSSYYLPAILADPIAHGLGLSRTTIFGIFSGALLLSAVLGPAVGRAIDNRGGRGMLALSNLVLAAGLVLLGVAQGFVTLALAWVALGVGMAMGLYDPAFATLTGLYGRAARAPITGITLIAGFASTVGWPLSAFLDAQFGWRAACLIWAALHLVIGLPLNRLLIPRAPPPARASEMAVGSSPAPRGAMAILAFVFAATWFVTGAMAAHLPRLLEIAGASTTAGNRGRRFSRTGAGCGASRRIRGAAHGASARIGSTGRRSSSDRGGNPGAARARCHHCLCGIAWCGEWSFDDRQGDRAAGDLRAGRLRPAQRDSRRTCACHTGGFAAALRSFDGLHGHRGAGDLGRPQPERVLRAADVEGATGGRACAGIGHGAGARHSILYGGNRRVAAQMLAQIGPFALRKTKP